LWSKTWEEKVVDLSDAADKNKNTMDTEFLDDVARFERELAALGTIDGKLTDAVKAC
jgi:hypothetical protein